MLYFEKYTVNSKSKWKRAAVPFPHLLQEARNAKLTLAQLYKRVRWCINAVHSAHVWECVWSVVYYTNGKHKTRNYILLSVRTDPVAIVERLSFVCPGSHLQHTCEP